MEWVKKIALQGLFLMLGLHAPLNSCPCIGRVEGNTPPLFSQEYDDLFWPDNNNKNKTVSEKKQDNPTNPTAQQS